jgi:hypothetical protein
MLLVMAQSQQKDKDQTIKEKDAWGTKSRKN